MFCRNSNGKIHLTWYVTAKEDIADFNLYVKGPLEIGTDNAMFKKSLTYSTRSAILSNFPTSEVFKIFYVLIYLFSL